MAATSDSAPLYLAKLRRVGAVLVVIGLIDMGVLIYSLMHDYKYASSFNVFAIAAGVFLLNGNLRAASLVRVFAAFFLAGALLAPLLFAFLMPPDLLVTMFRVCPDVIVRFVAEDAFAVFLLFWVIRELGSEPVRAATTEIGKEQRGLAQPAIAGVALIVILGIAGTIMLHSERAKYATWLAQQKTGPGYRIFVHSLGYQQNSSGAYSTASVYAWNDKGIWDFPVYWQTR